MNAEEGRVKSENMKYKETPTTGLRTLVEKSEGDKVTYFDPCGWTTPDGSAINLREKMYEEGNWAEKFEQVNRLAQKGEDVELKEAVKSVLESGRVSMPVYVDENIFVSDAQDQPLVDGLARVAVNTTEIRLDEVTEIGEIEGAFEESSDVELENDEIEKYEYSIYGVGIRKKVSDLLVHTDRYNPEQLKTETASEAIARYKERQALQGTDNDPDGFEGLKDWVSDSREFDFESETLEVSHVRDVVTELEVRGTNRADMMCVTDHRSFRELKDSLDEYQRFSLPEGGENAVSFGYTAIMVDGVLVAQTHGTESEAGEREIYAFDASGTFWAHLADTTVKPLAPTPDSVEQMLVYEYVTLASNARERIARGHGLGEAEAE